MKSSSPPLNQLVNRIPSPDIVPSTARAIAFWIAIVLPGFYVPILWSGLGDDQVTLFLILIGVNVISLVVGHDYKR